jgi:WYL domain
VRMERPASRGPEFEVPDWFDPSGVLPTAGEPDASPAATVRAGEAAARLAELRGAKRDGDPGPDGRLTLRMPILDRQGFVAWALGNGVEIVEPAELRHEARRRLEGLLDLVEEETGEGAVVRQATAAARRGSRPRGTGRQPGRRR